VCLKKPSSVFISRKASVLQLRTKIAEILADKKRQEKVKELMKMARIWRLDTGEDIFEIEKYYS
jgi:hypothetical protein